MPPSSILIDDRAGSSDLIVHPPLSSLGSLCRLDSGDVCFTGNGPGNQPTLVGVEVKTVLDLIASCNNGRLQARQIPRMLDDYDVVYLLYYGVYRPSVRGEDLQIRKGKRWVGYRIGKRTVPYGYVEQMLMTLSALGVRIKHVHDTREAAKWLGELHRWWSKKWEEHRGLKVFDNSRQPSMMPGVDRETMVKAMVASQLPGVGYKRAMAAARYFASIREMVNAGAEEWEKVEGVGKVVGKAVEEACR